MSPALPQAWRRFIQPSQQPHIPPLPLAILGSLLELLEEVQNVLHLALAELHRLLKASVLRFLDLCEVLGSCFTAIFEGLTYAGEWLLQSFHR